MKPVDPLELAEAPSITLGRREFKVCELVPRQNKIVTPAIFDLMEIFIRAKMAAESGNLLGMKITETQYAMLLKVVHVALLRAHPEVTLDDLEDMPIKTVELLQAFVVVARQAGAIPEKAPAGDGPLPETPAPIAAPPTGEPSPPRSPSPPDGDSTTS